MLLSKAEEKEGRTNVYVGGKIVMIAKGELL